MKSTILITAICLISQVVFPQQKRGGSSPAYGFSVQPPVISNEIKGSQALTTVTYALELFPGQVFDGWYYNWSYGGIENCVQKEYPEDVQWLSVSPRKFTSAGCNDIIPVKYSFLAPMEEGFYVTTIADSLSNWDSVRVELTVTKSPKNCIIRKIGINEDSLTYRSRLRYVPFNWANNTCVEDYFPADTLHYNFKIEPGVNWLTISPSAGQIFRNEEQDLRFTLKKKLYDSTWVILERDHHSFPAYYHYFVKETEPVHFFYNLTTDGDTIGRTGDKYLLQFNGENFINTGYYPSSSSKTLMFWVRFDEISLQALGANDLLNHRFYLGIDLDNSLFAGLGNMYTPLTSLNLIAGRWYNMVLTTTSMNGDSAMVYINATEVSRWKYTFSGESKASLYIAGRNDSTNNSFRYPIKGLIEEVQVWEKQLRRDEVIRYMFKPPLGNENGLVLYYPFNEGWGNFTKNTIDNYYNGILYYDPIWIDSIMRTNDPSIIITSIEENIQDGEGALMLRCLPNPFNSSAEIYYYLPGNGKVLLELYDLDGTLVKTLAYTDMISGIQNYNLNDATLQAGMYILRLTLSGSQGNYVKSIKIIRAN